MNRFDLLFHPSSWLRKAMGEYDTLLGTLLVGIFFNTYLFGIVTFQFATYYGSKHKDPLWIKYDEARSRAIPI